MGKAAASKKTTTATADLQQAVEVFDAKQRFFSSTLSMSWQLALTVVIPVVAGVKLDQKFDTSPSLTLTGFFLAAFAACYVVWNTVKDVNKMQAEDEKKKRGTRA
jgi:F0F1-type ATP synthase assembly protein I